MSIKPILIKSIDVCAKVLSHARVSAASFAVVSVTVFSLASVSLVAVSSASAYAQEAESNKSLGDKKTRRTPALRSRVFEQLSRAQTAGDSGDVDGAIAILDEVAGKINSMNSYERSMMYNFYGFVYYNSEQFGKAIENFELAVAQAPIPVKFEQTTVFSLSQLNMMQGNYDKTIEYLERWESLNNGVIPPKNFVLKAQAHYQNKNYPQAARYIELAIEGHEAEGYLPDEGWLILQRAVYYEMKQPEKVKDILAKMIRLYDNPKYWIQLAGMYGELGEEKTQLAMMETAYQMGYVESASDIFNLAQLYYYHQVPYKGALLMEQAMQNGVLQRNLRNLKFLATSWQAAKEDEKAVPVMQAAADLSDDGELDAQLGHLFYNTENYANAVEASRKALQKGVDKPGAVHMVLGLSLYNQRQFAEALDELAKAEGYPTSRGAAKQWGSFVSREKRDYEILKQQAQGI